MTILDSHVPRKKLHADTGVQMLALTPPSSHVHLGLPQCTCQVLRQEHPGLISCDMTALARSFGTRYWESRLPTDVEYNKWYQQCLLKATMVPIHSFLCTSDIFQHCLLHLVLACLRRLLTFVCSDCLLSSIGVTCTWSPACFAKWQT